MSSSPVQARLNAHDEQSIDRVEVTMHARLAWLERVDATEAYPAGAIRDAWNRAQITADHPVAREVDDLFLVFDLRGSTVVILTVFPESRLHTTNSETMTETIESEKDAQSINNTERQRGGQ